MKNEAMNTDLLREDERYALFYCMGSTRYVLIGLLAKRLIEEREISDHYLDQLTEARLQIVKLQAELGDGIH